MADRKYLNKEEQAEYLKKYNINANRAMFAIILLIDFRMHPKLYAKEVRLDHPIIE
jgi:hypothetical protein